MFRFDYLQKALKLSNEIFFLISTKHLLHSSCPLNVNLIDVKYNVINDNISFVTEGCRQWNG